MISVMEEPAVSCTGTLCQLFYLHGREVIGEDFNLNFMTFADAIKSGLTRFFVARTSSGEPVGYCYFNIYRSIMKASEIVADCQAIYVRPEYRGRTTLKLLKTAELCLKESKIDRIYMHIPSNTPTNVKMLTKLGYSLTEYTLDKEL